MTSRVRTLVVDDSAAMRAMLCAALDADPAIEVVGAAPEPHAARQMMRELDPDVVTLDVEMPGMDGLSFLEKIMRLRPTPVVMCSSLTTHAAEVTIEALRLGAVDFVAKPNGSGDFMARTAAELCLKVKAAALSRVRQSRTPASPPVPSDPAVAAGDAVFGDRVILIGSSTGGVDALFEVLPALPRNAPPVLVVQHMPPSFTTSLAKRLDGVCAMKVIEARDRALRRCGSPDRRRARVRPPYFGGCAVPFGPPARSQGRGRDPDRHGRRRSGRPAGHARSRRPDLRAG
jgi:two-component system chemotaxis response regulator CheB